MNNFFYEDLNKLNDKYLNKYIYSLKKIFKNDNFILGNNVLKFEKLFKIFKYKLLYFSQ